MASVTESKVFICAGSYKKFLNWCSENHENHHSQRFVVVTTPSLAQQRLRACTWGPHSKVVYLQPDAPTGRAFDAEIHNMKARQNA